MGIIWCHMSEGLWAPGGGAPGGAPPLSIAAACCDGLALRRARFSSGPWSESGAPSHGLTAKYLNEKGLGLSPLLPGAL